MTEGLRIVVPITETINQRKISYEEIVRREQKDLATKKEKSIQRVQDRLADERKKKSRVKKRILAGKVGKKS